MPLTIGFSGAELCRILLGDLQEHEAKRKISAEEGFLEN